MSRRFSRPLIASALMMLAACLLSLAEPTKLPAAEGARPVRALLVIGGGYHDYKKQQDLLVKGISARANVQWTVAYDTNTGSNHPNPIFQTDDWAKGYDVVLHDECSADIKDLKVIERVLKPHKEGLPGVVIHCGIHSYRSDGYPKSTPWFEFTGLASTGHGPQEPIEITYIEKDNPIAKGLTGWKTIGEELYNNSSGKLAETAVPVAKGKQIVKNKAGKENVAEAVVAWTNTYNSKTKVFGTTLGHNNATVADERYLDLLARGLLWSVGKLEPAYLKPAEKALISDSEKK